MLNIIMAQQISKVGQPDINQRSMVDIIHKFPEANLIVWPELFIPGYTTDLAHDLAQTLSHPGFRELQHLAARKNTALIFGISEKLENGQYANSMLAIDEHGQIASCYRKIQLFGDEASVFKPGNLVKLAKICGRNIGLMNCFDIEFPEIARELATRGAELLVTISANMEPYGPDHRLFARARALENRIPHIYVNQVGQSDKFQFTGCSCHVDANGFVRESCSATQEDITQSFVDFNIEKQIRPDYLALRRYGFIHTNE